MEDDFPGGVIGKIHATDQDVYDVLTYTLKSDQKSLFKVNSHDGKIIALGGLDNGKYVLNVSVSDGRFQVPIDVVVHVEQLLQEMLQNTVTIRFENVSPEDFVGLHMHGFRRTLRNAVLSQKQDSLHIISIQPVAGSSQLDMLFAVQMHNGGFYKPAYLIQKLTNARRHLENVIRISAILEKNCSGLDCQEQHCEQSLSIDSHSLMTYSTARISFVCPRFYRNVRCMCNGEYCSLFPSHRCTLCDRIHFIPLMQIRRGISIQSTKARLADALWELISQAREELFVFTDVNGSL